MKTPHVPGGYAGNILFVDLTNRKFWKEELDVGLAEKFIGGPGIGLNILRQLLRPVVDRKRGGASGFYGENIQLRQLLLQQW